MLIADREHCQHVLSTLNYYRLSGYWFPLFDQKTGQFKDGTRFTDIVAYYEFDEQLRSWLFAGLSKIETSIRALLGYELGKIPVSMGIDTWAVDFALLDKEDHLIGKTVGYRDGRTKGMDQEVYKVISQDELYERTGIQKQIFNTIYQLMAVKMKKPQELADAKTMLLIPDYFNFLLTGRKVTEYTNASTTQLLHPETKEWDFELIDMLGFPRDIFTEIKLPGTIVGELTEEIQEKVGFCCKVVLPATHDTGSAVVAVPSNEEDVLYISSGTWSLMGTELKEAIDSVLTKMTKDDFSAMMDEAISVQPLSE